MRKKTGLELKLDKDIIRKTVYADTFGNITYSLILGSILDYYSGLNIPGIISARFSATIMNTFASGPYGLWREEIFKITKTNEDSSRVRKTLLDLVSYNTFRLPMYGVAIAIGSFSSEGKVDMEKVQNGVTYLAALSPIIGPTLGLYMNFCRKIVGVNSAEKGSYIKREN
jgi:hypothetical protein